MSAPDPQTALAALFQQLGARDPAGWAYSQLAEGIPQLQRFLFLQQVWERLISASNYEWIDKAIERSKAYPDEPYAGLGQALSRAIDKGVSREDLNEIGRCLQAQALFSIAYVIDGPAYHPPGTEGIEWGLFQTTEDGKPFGRQISGLYESVLETEPEGREMRPRSE